MRSLTPLCDGFANVIWRGYSLCPVCYSRATTDFVDADSEGETTAVEMLHYLEDVVSAGSAEPVEAALPRQPGARPNLDQGMAHNLAHNLTKSSDISGT